MRTRPTEPLVVHHTAALPCRSVHVTHGQCIRGQGHPASTQLERELHWGAAGRSDTWVSSDPEPDLPYPGDACTSWWQGTPR